MVTVGFGLHNRGIRAVGRSVKVALLLAFVVAVPAGARAGLECRAEVNRRSVPQGDEVVLTITAEGDAAWGASFELPQLAGVQVFGGGTNQSMSFSNGRQQASVSRTYYLRVGDRKDFTIEPILVTAAGQECRTEAIAISVTAPAATPSIPPADTGNRQPRSTSRPGNVSSDAPSGGDVFVTLKADRTEAWVGQQIILSFRYYRRVQPWNNPQYTAPRTEGFWREDLGSERNFRQTVQGRAYNVTEIRYAVFPTHSGELIIEPAELRFPDDVFDRFFNSRRREGPRVLRTDAVTVTVKDLPRPRPAGFSGIVATQLDLVSEVDRDSVPRGEPIGLRVQLTSDGFLKGFSGLTIDAPADTRLHDAGEHFRTDLVQTRLKGTLVVEKVIVPSQEGELEPVPVEVVWFDAGRGAYRTARTAPPAVTVTPSDLPVGSGEGSGFLRNEIARLGQDLAFIHPVSKRVRWVAAPFVARPFWWIGVLLPVLLLAGWRLAILRLSADRRDPAGRRRRLALGTARRILRTAAKEDDPTFVLAELHRAVTGFVGDSVERPSAAVGAVEIRSFCAAKGEAETGERLVEILTELDAARYGGKSTVLAAELGDEIDGLVRRLHAARPTGESSRKGRLASLALMACLAWNAANMPGAANAAAAAAQPAPGGPDPVRLLAEGNQAYTEGDLATALARYRTVLELGADDPTLHFNLGNTHARRGELGRAVASYLRARRLAPRDRDIRANLEWVKGQGRDLELVAGELPLFVAQSAALVDSLTLNEWSVVLLVLVWVLAGLVGWGFYREDFGSQLRRVLLGLAGLTLCLCVLVAWRWQRGYVREEAVVIVAESVVRSGPAESFPVLFEVHDGLVLEIESEREGWYRIGLGGEWIGWLPGESLEKVRLSRSADLPPELPQGR